MVLEEIITESLWLSVLAFLVGIGLVLGSTEKFIEYVSAAAVRLGISAFLLTAVFAGADWEIPTCLESLCKKPNTNKSQYGIRNRVLV